MYSVDASALPAAQLKNRIQTPFFLSKVYTATVLLIGLVSLYDALLVFQYREVIEEQNPFCAWLISLEPEYVSLFLAGKGLGTISVMAILFLLFRHWSRLAIPVAASLMMFQVGLMGYLHGTDGRRPAVAQMAARSSDTFSSFVAESEKAVAPKSVKAIPGKPTRSVSNKPSAGKGQQRVTKAQRRRLRIQRQKDQIKNIPVNPAYSNAKRKNNTRSKQRVLNLEDR